MRAALVALALLAALPASGCALGPVEDDPIAADQRAAAMKRDCHARGGVWNEDRRSCVGADPLR